MISLDGKPFWRVILTSGSKTYSFTGEKTTDPNDLPLLSTLGSMSEGLNGLLGEIQASDVSFTLLNSDDSDHFSELLKDGEISISVKIYLGDYDSSESVLMFDGYVRDVSFDAFESVNITAQDASIKLLNTKLGTEVTTSLFPNARTTDIGKIFPFVTNIASKVPVPCIQDGTSTKLAETYYAYLSTSMVVESVSNLFVGSDYIIGRNTITLTGINAEQKSVTFSSPTPMLSYASGTNLYPATDLIFRTRSERYDLEGESRPKIKKVYSQRGEIVSDITDLVEFTEEGSDVTISKTKFAEVSSRGAVPSTSETTFKALPTKILRDGYVETGVKYDENGRAIVRPTSLTDVHGVVSPASGLSVLLFGRTDPTPILDRSGTGIYQLTVDDDLFYLGDPPPEKSYGPIIPHTLLYAFDDSNLKLSGKISKIRITFKYAFGGPLFQVFGSYYIFFPDVDFSVTAGGVTQTHTAIKGDQIPDWFVFDETFVFDEPKALDEIHEYLSVSFTVRSPKYIYLRTLWFPSFAYIGCYHIGSRFGIQDMSFEFSYEKSSNSSTDSVYVLVPQNRRFSDTVEYPYVETPITDYTKILESGYNFGHRVYEDDSILASDYFTLYPFIDCVIAEQMHDSLNSSFSTVPPWAIPPPTPLTSFKWSLWEASETINSSNSSESVATDTVGANLLVDFDATKTVEEFVNELMRVGGQPSVVVTSPFYSDYMLNGALINQMQLSDAIHTVCFQSGFEFRRIKGVPTLLPNHPLDETLPEVYTALTSDGARDLKVSKSSITDLINEITYSFSPIYYSNSFASSKTIRNDISIGDYGTQSKDEYFSYSLIIDSDTAEYLSVGYLTKYSKRRILSEFRIFLDRLEVHSGRQISVDFDSNLHRVLEAEIQVGSDNTLDSVRLHTESVPSAETIAFRTIEIPNLVSEVFDKTAAKVLVGANSNGFGFGTRVMKDTISVATSLVPCVLELRSALESHSETTIDSTTILLSSLSGDIRSSLQSLEIVDFLNMTLPVCVIDNSGNMEMISIKSLVSISSGSNIIASGLIRGCYGTVPRKFEVGSKIIIPNSSFVTLPMATQGTNSFEISNFNTQTPKLSTQLQVIGESLRPYPPCELRAVYRADGTKELHWTRRDRNVVAGFDDAPLSESVELYKVEILACTTGSVVRSLTVPSASYTYSVLEQTQDYLIAGDYPESTKPKIRVRITQIGDYLESRPTEGLI